MPPGRAFTRAQVAEHNSKNSCWVIIDSKVYDLTSFFDEHPGGADLVLKWAGKDGTKAFDNASHSDDAVDLKSDYIIGYVEDSPPQKSGKTKKKKNGNNNFIERKNSVSPPPSYESISLSSRIFGMEEISKHNSRNSSWVVINNTVYDLTSFLDEHPGGADLVLKWAGKDGTKAFDNASHSDDAIELSEDYKIGTLAFTSQDSLKNEANYVTRVEIQNGSGGGGDSRKYTSSQVGEHNSPQSAWVLIHGDVYDLTSFLDEHPGGADLILKWAGKDGSKAFDNASHSDDAIQLSEDYKIGVLDDNAPSSSGHASSANPPEPRIINPRRSNMNGTAETHKPATEEICTCCPKCCYVQ